MPTGSPRYQNDISLQHSANYRVRVLTCTHSIESARHGCSTFLTPLFRVHKQDSAHEEEQRGKEICGNDRDISQRSLGRMFRR